VQNGKFAEAAPAFVIALKSVDLPTFGSPTIPSFIYIIPPLKGHNSTHISYYIFMLLSTTIKMSVWLPLLVIFSFYC
jgi:hypothetical protein